MHAAEIAPAHYLGHLGLPSYPRPAVGPKFKRGQSLYFPQISNKRVPSSVKKSQNKRVPDRNMVLPNRLIPHSYSVGAKTTSPPALKPRRPPSFAASDLLPLRRHTAMATQSTIWPWVLPSLHPPEHRFPRQKEEDRHDMWRRPHRQPKMVLIFPYSCKSYVSACTVFIPQKTLVDRFFLILDVPSNSRCTRFLLIYYFTLARGPSPP